MIRFIKIIAIAIVCFVDSLKASDASYPENWESWPIVGSNQIPPAGTDTSDLPAVVANTFKAYGWVNEGKGSAYNVRVNPEAKKEEIPDGPTAVMELTDIKVILVTEHILGEPQYGVYSIADQVEISNAHPSLNIQTCINCHTGFADLTKAGVFSLKD